MLDQDDNMQLSLQPKITVLKVKSTIHDNMQLKQKTSQFPCTRKLNLLQN